MRRIRDMPPPKLKNTHKVGIFPFFYSNLNNLIQSTASSNIFFNVPVAGITEVTQLPRQNAGARPSPQSDSGRAAEPPIPAASRLAERVDPLDARRAAQCALNIPPRARNPDALTVNVLFVPYREKAILRGCGAPCICGNYFSTATCAIIILAFELYIRPVNFVDSMVTIFAVHSAYHVPSSFLLTETKCSLLRLNFLL